MELRRASGAGPDGVTQLTVPNRSIVLRSGYIRQESGGKEKVRIRRIIE